MSSSRLAEIRATVDRSDQKIEDLKAFLPNRPMAVDTGDLAAVELQPDGKTHDIIIGIAEPSANLRMAIGDVIHGLRAALDHLAYQLALKNGFPPAGSRTPEHLRQLRPLVFMIYDRKERFRPTAGKVKQLIGSTAVAQMERLQLYKGLDPRASVLWRLAELDNITKHRMLAVLAHELKRAEVAVTVGDQTFRGTVTGLAGQDLKDRTKLVSFVIEGLPQPPKVNVDVQTHISVVFTDTDGLCDGTNVFVVMRESVAAVRSVIDEFEKLFF